MFALGVEFYGRIACRIEPANDGTYRRARDAVDMNACLFEHLQHAYLSGSFGAAASEGQPYLWSPCHRRYHQTSDYQYDE